MLSAQLCRHIIYGNKNPSWNTWLDFGGRKSWANGSIYKEITVRDKDLIFDATVIATQSFSINPGYHRGLQHCNNAQCSRCLVFDYSLILDGNECRPNRCVRGTCTDLISDYRCNCPSGYGGKRCESRVGIISGRLRICARYGTELPDRDSGLFTGHSDPYVRVIAYRSRGSSKSL